MLAPVVFDVNVFVRAVVTGNSEFGSWPSPPPTSGNPAADCLGIVVDAEEFGLWLSSHILRCASTVLSRQFGWPSDKIGRFLAVVVRIARRAGDVVEPMAPVDDCPDHEDNRILELALAANAALIVSDDIDLLAMSPWRGIPIMTTRDFAGRVDAMRRARRIAAT